MRVKNKRLIPHPGLMLALAAALLLGFAGDAAAGANKLDGFGQYLVVKAAGGDGDNNEFEASNPTASSLYGCLIHYDSGGDFESCTCDIVPPMGTFTDSSGIFGSGHVEWICAPSMGKNAGRIRKSFGMMGRAHRGVQARALDPKLFRLHPNSTERSDMLTACCSEMAGDGIAKDFFESFDDGFICP